MSHQNSHGSICIEVVDATPPEILIPDVLLWTLLKARIQHFFSQKKYYVHFLKSLRYKA